MTFNNIKTKTNNYRYNYPLLFRHILHSGLTSVPNFENFVTVNKDQNGLIDEM